MTFRSPKLLIACREIPSWKTLRVLIESGRLTVT